ncbi:RsmB/NOP family class I SAM-dependent RNA methyltransferase [Myxococcota bacterium]|nr:RsmB/NOP family class I SAM-dependent RNA methyltransferase [Myxococcota bacterium]
MPKQHTTKGPSAFDAWYQQQWGERWPLLREALCAPSHHVAWWNPHTSLDPLAWLPPDATTHDAPNGCYSAATFPPPALDPQGIPCAYLLDAASVWVALALNPPPHAKILDLCAAPGGKSAILASMLGPHGHLTANDRSAQRRQRLRQVLHSYFPTSLHSQFSITGHDAERWCLHQTNAYTHILLDAPCSSERHLLHQPSLLLDWTPARSKQLAQRQYTMLASALQVLQPQGRLLYSTCSISPLENDLVLARLLHKKPSAFVFLPLDLPPYAETTQHGYHILPDRSPHGPIFLAALQKS